MTTVSVPVHRRIALLVLLLAMFMDLLDATIVTIALPAIQQGLDASPAAVQWVAAGYTLALAVGLIAGGRLGDLFGRRRIFLLGVAAFTVASVACAVARSPGQLIAARVVQGLAAALMLPQILAVIQVMYPPAERGRAISAFGALAAVATVGGPLLGALLTAGVSWRLIFGVNLPVGVLVLVAGLRYVPESRAAARTGLDLPGAALLAVAMSALLLPLVQGRELGWPLWTCLLSALPFAAFLAWERRARSPLIPGALFRHRSFAGGLLIGLAFTAGVVGFQFVFAVHLQSALGYGILRAGLTMLPWAVAVPLLAVACGVFLTRRFGRLTLDLGLALLIAAMACLMWTPPGRGWVPVLLLGGAGMGLIVSPILDFTLADVPGDHAGAASGLFGAIQQAGAAFGVATVASLYYARLPAGVASGEPSAGADVPESALAVSLWLPIAFFLLALAAVRLLPRHAATPSE